MPQFHEHDDITNRILLALPPATLRRIRPALEPLNTTVKQVIARVNGPVTHLYFVKRGIVSLVKTMQDGRTVEIGAVGVEGITDPNALFGVIDGAVMDSVVQIPGTAFSIRRDALRREIEQDDRLKSLMQGYTQFFVNQIVQTAACNRLHSLEERAAGCWSPMTVRCRIRSRSRTSFSR